MTTDAPPSAALLAELRSLDPSERVRRIRAEPDLRSALRLLGDEAERLALVAVNEAIAAAELAVALADACGQAAERARCRRARAQALAYAGRHAEALTVCAEAVQIATAAGAHVEAARARAISLHPLGELGRYEEAVAEGEAARAALLEAGEPLLAARADFNLGVIHQNRDDPARALFHFDRAAPAFADDPVITGYLQSNRGEALLLLNDFEGARRAFQTALDACERAGVHVAAAIAEGNLADLAARQGQLQPALFHFERARRRLERVEAPGHLNRLLAEQAEALDSLGLAPQALAAYQEVIPRLESHGLAWEAARARAGMGRVLLRLAQPDAAENVLCAAAEAFARLDHTIASARVQLLRGELAIERGQLDQAQRLLADAEPHLRHRPLDAAALGYHQARLAHARGELERAIEAAGKALEVARGYQIAPLHADLAHLRGRLAHEAGRLEEALSDLRAAVEQVERVRGTLQADHLRAAFLGRRSTIYEDLVRALLDAGGDAAAGEALAVMERAKSRSLMELVQGAVDPIETDQEQAGDETDVQLRRTAARLRSELNALYTRLAEYRATERHKVSMEQWRAAARLREQELAGLETRIATARGVASLYSRPADIGQICGALDDEQAAIEYFVAGDELLAMVLTRQGQRVFRRLAGAGELVQRVQRLRFQLHRVLRPDLGDEAAKRMLRDVRRELHGLWSLLIAPLAGALAGARKLLLIPHGALHLVPMHALWDGQRYLVETHEIVYSPSASFYAYLCSAPAGGRLSAPGGGALVVGYADSAAPQIAAEAARVGALLAAELRCGPEATCQAVQTLAGRADIIHFACHGQFSSRHPLSSGLKLADRWLTVRDIYALRLRAELVTLSGCNTGRNLVCAGDELVGLLRGFFAAGARSLLVSLWPAHDEKTSRLMTDFYNGWRGQVSGHWAKAAALRQSQRALLSQQPHPAFWAPFVLVGRP